MPDFRCHIHCIKSTHSISVLLNHLHSTVKYKRIFPVESLSKVENPWKGFTLNRCILVAMVIVVVSSGVEIVQGEFSNAVVCAHVNVQRVNYYRK